MANRTVLIYPDPESDYWVAECPSLPVCVSQGKTHQEALLNIKEAIENIREAIRVYIESLEEDGIPVPTDECEIVQAARMQPPEQ